MRKEPELNPPAKIEPIQKTIKQARKYELITPLYGGGVEPNKADPISTVRATEIRGQLRFWWRATCGGRFDGNLEKMREQEEKIWGSSAEKNKPGPSLINICVIEHNPGNEIKQIQQGKEKVDIWDQNSKWGYVSFPLREEEGKVRQNVRFTIEISFPEAFQADIETSLWAWEHFGGIGARTRRGFGALKCVKVDAKTIQKITKTQMREEIQEWLSKINGRWLNEIPHISDKTKYGIIERKNSITAWEALIFSLKKFRQQLKKDHGIEISNELDRNIVNEISSMIEDDEQIVDRLPSAQFGLPIIYKLDEDSKKGEPSQITLKGKHHDRLASRLILRPIDCVDGGLGLALVLEGPMFPPGGLILDKGKKDENVDGGLGGTEANAIPPLKSKTDVLQAFLNYLK
ncbi:MAG: type III-B CRISPR module RAMP protein Cmr1 [Pelolinea sp.]|jgi:CRISPR-associated protein Cmr1|nr:type III-B CRISPR module RAMP protein Cmr1 [Pelolinea sp.]